MVTDSEVTNSERLREQIRSAIEGGAKTQNEKLQSHMACYSCVLVSAYLEVFFQELVEERLKNESCNSQIVTDYYEKTYRNFMIAANNEEIKKLISFLEEEKGNEYGKFSTPEIKSALSAVRKNRNKIAHGRISDISIHRMKDYFAEIEKVIDWTQKAL